MACFDLSKQNLAEVNVLKVFES